jgi:hypothetical protein
MKNLEKFAAVAAISMVAACGTDPDVDGLYSDVSQDLADVLDSSFGEYADVSFADSYSEVSIGSDADSKPGSDADSKPGSDADSKPGSDADSKPGSDADSKPGSDADSKPGSDADSKPGSDADSKPGSDAVTCEEYYSYGEECMTLDSKDGIADCFDAIAASPSEIQADCCEYFAEVLDSLDLDADSKSSFSPEVVFGRIQNEHSDLTGTDCCDVDTEFCDDYSGDRDECVEWYYDPSCR